MNIACVVLISMVLSLTAAGCQTSSFTAQAVKPGPENSVHNVSVNEENDELDSKERRAWRQARKNYLKSLYQERLDPYFGKSDQGASCEAQSVKQLVESSNDNADYVTYQILTTDSGAVGVCDPQMQTHRMTLVFAACANRPLQFTLKVICPLASDNQLDECRVGEEQITNYCIYRSLSGARN